MVLSNISNIGPSINEIDNEGTLIKFLIKELNKNSRKICIISILQTGQIFGIFDSISFIPAEGSSKQFQIKGKDITTVVSKYLSLNVTLDTTFLSSYLRDLESCNEFNIWLPESQFGYIWFIS